MRAPLLRSFWLGLLMVVVVAAARFDVAADDEPPQKPEKSAAAKSTSAEKAVASVKKSAGARFEQKIDDAAALKFAREHHPELASLLEQLKQGAPKEYQAAIADLERSRQRLERSQERMPERYQLELTEWKVNSRIRLLVARITMSHDAALEGELRQAIQQRVEIRAELLREERTRISQRLERIDEQIAQVRDRNDELVEREMASLLKSAAAAGSRTSPSKSTPRDSAVNAKPLPSSKSDSKAVKPPKLGNSPKSPDKTEKKS